MAWSGLRTNQLLIHVKSVVHWLFFYGLFDLSFHCLSLFSEVCNIGYIFEVCSVIKRSLSVSSFNLPLPHWPLLKVFAISRLVDHIKQRLR